MFRNYLKEVSTLRRGLGSGEIGVCGNGIMGLFLVELLTTIWGLGEALFILGMGLGEALVAVGMVPSLESRFSLELSSLL